LRDSTELVSLLAGWRWQVVHAALVAGASWEQIALATGTTTDHAHANHVAAIERQERHGLRSSDAYRSCLLTQDREINGLRT
jgi:hypothetical protein